MTQWRFTTLSEYTQALASDPEPQKGMLRQIWDHYMKRVGTVDETEIEFETPELQSAPARLLDWVSPPPDWATTCALPLPDSGDNSPAHTEQASATLKSQTGTDGTEAPLVTDTLSASAAVCLQLTHWLKEWHEHGVDGPGVRMILAAPHSQVPAMVTGWATREGYIVCTPPTPAEIFDENNPWLEGLQQQLAELPQEELLQRRLVLVGLERCYLRHHNGLTLIRQLMDYLTTTAPPSLVVCHSWAWAYLCNAIHIDAMVRPPLTLTRRSGEALQKWLIELSSGSHYRTFTFRQGRDILLTIGLDASPDNGPQNDPGKPKSNQQRDELASVDVNEKASQKYFDALAELSRGNPGVARGIWRANLSIEKADNIHERIQQEAEDDPGYTIWVQPIDASILPSVPTTFTTEDAFILQTLLIHDGIPRDLLPDTLPLSASRISRRLQIMRNAGLVRWQNELVEVAPLGYLPVREFLRSYGFFVDEL